MAAQSLAAQVQGQGAVSASNLNTYLQQCDTAVQLRSFVGLTGMKAFVGGNTANGDGGAGVFYWNAASTSADNGTTIIAPSFSTLGRWVRIGYLSVAPLIVTGMGVAANSTIVIPAGYGIGSLFIDNTVALAMTAPGLQIGTTNGGAEVINGLAVGASALFKVPDSTMIKSAFSLTAATTLYTQAVTAWNGAILNMTFNLVPFL